MKRKQQVESARMEERHRFVIDPSSREFAEQILSDLIAEGNEGQKLLSEFKIRQTKVRPAIEAMLEETKEVAFGNGEYSTYEDIFGAGD